jgi:hypothetical protein
MIFSGSRDDFNRAVIKKPILMELPSSLMLFLYIRELFKIQGLKFIFDFAKVNHIVFFNINFRFRAKQLKELFLLDCAFLWCSFEPEIFE